MNDLLSTFLRPETIALIAAAWAVVEGLNRLGLKKNELWWRILPIIPLVVGALLALAPGVLSQPDEWGSKLVYGLIAGGLAGTFRKTIKRQLSEKWGNGK